MTNASSSFFVALVSLSVKPLSRDEFVKKLECFVSEAHSKKAKIVIFPEYSIAPILFAFNSDLIKASHFLEKTLRKLAVQYKIYICSGSGVYQIQRSFYNQSFLANPSGEVIYQQKMNLIESEKTAEFTSGTEVKIINTPFVKLAICICYDIEFPELVRKIVLEGVDLILAPSYTIDKYGVGRVQYCAQARAIENHIYIAKSCLVERGGHAETPCGFGSSALYSPIDIGFNENGIVAESTADMEDLLVVEVDLAALYALRQNSSTSPLQDYKNLDLNKILFSQLVF